MASLEEAYSIEYGEIINSELAYDLFWAGLITDKTMFLCPGDNCDGKVTCVNLEKARQDMHQMPHFRSYNHGAGCEWTNEGGKAELQVSLSDSQQAHSVKSDAIPDIFYLDRPANQFAHRTTSSALKKIKGKPNTKGSSASDREVNTGSKYYSVRSLVSKYIRFRKDNSLATHKVNISGTELTYDRLFKGIYNQPIRSLPRENLIYWGVAFIDYMEKQQCFKVNFGEKLYYNQAAIRPSFFIHQETIDNYPVKNLVISRLEKITKLEDRRAFVFIYSKPYAQKKGDNIYINFEFHSLDHLEIRYLDLFDDL